MSHIPHHHHFTIIEYRDFFDVPRCILAKDERGTYWLLKSPFDDVTDEYSENYSLFEAGQEEAYARTAYYRHCSGDLRDATVVLPVASLEFDATKRASFRVSPAPRVDL